MSRLSADLVVDDATRPVVHGHNSAMSGSRILAVKVDDFTLMGDPDRVVELLRTAYHAAVAERARVWPPTGPPTAALPPSEVA